MILRALMLLLLVLPRPVPVSREAITMGTTLRISVEAPSHHQGVEATERVLAAVDSLDRMLSTWHPSLLDSLNHGPVGQPQRMSGPLASLLAEVMAWTDSLPRVFEPVSGALTDAWQLRGEGRDPSSRILTRALAATGARGMHVNAMAGQVTRVDSLAWLDSGGFGKGAALRAAGQALRQVGIGAAVLDFGGQLLLLGAPPGRDAWPAAIADPRDRARAALRLHVRDASVATSSQSERAVVIGGQRLGHLLDPRSGRPVPAWGSASVIAADPLVADILSTALFVLGPDAAMRWAEDHPAVGVVLLITTSRGLELRYSSGARPYLDAPSIP